MKLQHETYQDGVQDVLELARRVAKGLEGSSIKPTRTPFASAALQEFADAAEELLLGKKRDGESETVAPSDPDAPLRGPGRMTTSEKVSEAAE